MVAVHWSSSSSPSAVVPESPFVCHDSMNNGRLSLRQKLCWVKHQDFEEKKYPVLPPIRSDEGLVVPSKEQPAPINVGAQPPSLDANVHNDLHQEPNVHFQVEPFTRRSSASLARQSPITREEGDGEDQNSHNQADDEEDEIIATGIEPELSSLKSLEQDSRIVEFPSYLPKIEGLLPALSAISMERLRRVHDHCQFKDMASRGVLGPSQLIAAFAHVIPSADHKSSPWYSLIRSLCPPDQFINYSRLIRFLCKAKFGPMEKDGEQSIADILLSQHSIPVLAELPDRPSSIQAMKELGRVQVMNEIKNLMQKFPDIDLNRLKMATTKKIVEPDELRLILELHGLESHFKPLLDRLIPSFSTTKRQFHYAAFLGCIEHIQSKIMTLSAPSALRKNFAAPLPPIGKTIALSESHGEFKSI